MDLLDHLAQLNDTDRVRHMLMPCMAFACGVDVLTTLRAQTYGEHRVLATSSADVTCPACLTAYGDLAGLRTEIARQNGRQGAAT